jgi:hypothetical protein
MMSWHLVRLALPRRQIVQVIWLGSVAAMTASCGDDDRTITSPVAQGSTWFQVQQILATNCTSCHTQGTSQARQSGLILTKDVAYAELVGQAPTNPAALADGLLRVGTDGPVSLPTSLLWEKINAPNEDHFSNDHGQYGTLMPPPPQRPLTYGELELIRKWIFAGAPETGAVADVALLENVDRYTYGPEDFVALSPPATGTQLHLGPFEVLSQAEREFFYYQALENDEPVYVDRVEIAMRQGSHHFILYGFSERTPEWVIPAAGVFRDLRDDEGTPILANYRAMPFHQFFVGTQWPAFNMDMPAGVALKIPANFAFDMNAHYVNRSNSAVTGEVFVNLHYVDPGRIEHVAEVIDFNNTRFSLPAGQTTTLEQLFTFDERANVFQLFSHAHELNTQFRVEIAGGARDGEEVYFSNDWEHPPIVEYDPPMVLESGEGFRLMATYENTRDRDVAFGLLSTDEMMILFGLYYPD